MDWKQLAATFAAVFLAELGDKTQLATFGLASESSSKLATFLGSASALVTTSLIAVLAGGLIGKVASPLLIQRASGVLFIGLGLWTLWTSLRA